MNEDILVSTVRDILKVHISLHGLDFIKTTLLRGYISDAPRLWPESTCPALCPTLSSGNYSLCEENSQLLTSHTISGVHLVSRPGVKLIRFVFQNSASLMQLYLPEERRYYKIIYILPDPASFTQSHRSSPRGNLKSYIGDPTPSISSLSVTKAYLGTASQTCDTR